MRIYRSCMLFFLLVPLGLALSWAAPTHPTSPVSQAGRQQQYAHVPLSFEPNVGQSDASVQFLTHGQGYTAWLSATQATLQRQGQSSASTPLRFQFVGASQKSHLQGEQPLSGMVNYLVGQDASKWHTNIATFGQVRATSLYPGIDLLYYGQQQQVEYDLIVAPGADASQIKLRFTGADHLGLNEQGDLLIGQGKEQIVQQKPVIYQQISGQRQPVAGSYVLLGNQQVGFALGAYDHRQPLTIDPLILLYSTYLGGGGSDSADSIAVDSAGNAYIAGSTDSLDFFTTPGAWQTSHPAGITVAYVSKLNASGSALIYSTYLGGSKSVSPDKVTVSTESTGIALDSAGNAYIAGYTTTSDFPTTPNALQPTIASQNTSSFVSKLSASGNALIYSTYLGKSSSTAESFLAVDSAGNAYVAGNSFSPGLLTTPGAWQTSFKGPADAYVSKLNASGSALVYSTYLGGSGSETVNALAVDSAGNAYIAGSTDSLDFFTTPGAFQTSHPAGITVAYVSKLNTSGSALIYSTYLGGSKSASPDTAAFVRLRGIALDSTGNAYIAGSTDSLDFPTTPGAWQTSLKGREDGFVSKLNTSGSTLVYSTYLGGNDFAGVNSIALDSAGNAYVAGNTTSSDFSTTPGALQTSLKGSEDGFVSKLNTSGSTLVYSTYLGGGSSDSANALVVDSAGNAYVAGNTTSSDFSTTPGAWQVSLKGATDGFVSKLTLQNGGQGWQTVPNATSQTAVTAIHSSCAKGLLLFQVFNHQIRYQVLPDGSSTWSALITVPGSFSTDVEVTAAEFQSASSQSCAPLYLFAKAPNQGPLNSNAFSYAVFTGSAWAPWQPLPPPGGTSVGASAAVLAGKLYLFSVGTDNRAYYRTFDGSTWTPFAVIGADATACKTAASPRVEVYQGVIYIIVSNQADSTVCSITFSPTTLAVSPWTTVPGNLHTDVALSSAVTGNVLSLFAKSSSDTSINVNSFSGSTWQGWSPVLGGGQTTLALSAVAASDGSIQLFRVNQDNSVSLTTVNGTPSSLASHK